MPTKKVTIREVARAAGVSAQTVSRVINHHPDVAADTREHIQKIILELGYAPNIIAQSLSRGRSHTLGVIGYGLEYFGSTGVLRGIEHKANELWYSLLLGLIDQVEPARVDRVVMDLLSRQVDGVIWIVPGRQDHAQWLSEKLGGLSVPFVYLNKSQVHQELIVALDNRTGGRLATQHLLEQGYCQIGIITGPDQWWEATERETGWRETLFENNMIPSDNLKVTGDWNAASGEVGLTTLLTQNPALEAVFVSNDQMALGALQAARRHGLRVPEDLGVVGFDDLPESAYFYPPLTTVRQNTLALGALAVEVLCARIEAQRQGETFGPGISWVKPRLVVRQSSVRS
jgi:LacI family transcriptional regulator